ncbi:MAG: DUF971 domain-containing protein [Candidatus Neomarinimicrobiota bacterium]
MSPLSMEAYDVVNDILVIRWSDGEESYVSLKKLRDACPCAECAGEKDALGNVYGGYGRPKGETGYEMASLRSVGYYAIQPFWKDGHDTGIYRFELLRSLSSSGDRGSNRDK